MNEMEERVARALAHSAGAHMCGPGRSVATREFGWKGDGKHLDEYADTHWKEHEHAAGFAIEAMRVPTEAMLKAGALEQRGTREIWQAMIDEALK